MKQQGSRLSRTLEHQSKKQLYIFLGGFVLIILFLALFGFQILDYIGTFMIPDQNSETNSEQVITAVTPPTLTSLPNATNNEVISVKGAVIDGNGTVELFVNGRKEGTQKITKDTTFEFKNVRLKEGENTIKARYAIDSRTSDFTKDYIVTLMKEPPILEELSPQEGTEFKRGDQRIEVTGKTNPQNTVTVNGFRAVVDEDGAFSYFLTLIEGDNTIQVIATNPPGAQTTKEIKVAYHP